MTAVEKNSEIINDILVVHVTDKLMPLKGLLTLLKMPQTISGVVINNKVPDYIPDQYSISYLLDIISNASYTDRKLAIIPFSSLQKAMFEIVLEEFESLDIKINYFKEINPALSWIHQIDHDLSAASPNQLMT
jgi:hypothetical protein